MVRKTFGRPRRRPTGTSDCTKSCMKGEATAACWSQLSTTRRVKRCWNDGESRILEDHRCRDVLLGGGDCQKVSKHMAVELKMKETSSSWSGGWEWGIFGITIGSVGIGTRSTGCPALFKDFQFIPNLPEVEVVLKEHVQFAKFRCTWANRPTKWANFRLNHSCWAIPPYRPDTFYFDI